MVEELEDGRGCGTCQELLEKAMGVVTEEEMRPKAQGVIGSGFSRVSGGGRARARELGRWLAEGGRGARTEREDGDKRGGQREIGRSRGFSRLGVQTVRGRGPSSQSRGSGLRKERRLRAVGSAWVLEARRMVLLGR